MTKEQKKRADELLKEIDNVKGYISHLSTMKDNLSDNNNNGYGLKFETGHGWYYLKNSQFSLTFIAIARAECDQRLKDLEAEFAAL